MRAISKVLAVIATAGCALATVGTNAKAATLSTAGASQPTISSSGTGNANAPVPPPPPPQLLGVETAAGLLPAPLTNGNMSYHNGRVLKGFTRVALIFWGSGWPGNGRQNTVIGMFSHMGANPWSDTVLQYWDNWSSTDNTGALYAGSWVDTGSNPPGTFSPTDLETETLRAFTVGGLSYDANTLYLVYPQSGSHTDQGTGVCGYHTWDPYYMSGLVYGGVDYQNCPISVSGATGDSISQHLTDTSSHEFAEAVTDPFGDGWYNTNPQGGEIGDMCNNNLIAWNFGGTSYAVQQLWSNQAGGCASSTSATYSYTWVTQTYTPNPAEPRQLYSVSLVVRNSGNVQWPARSIMSLGTDVPQNRCSAFYDAGSWSSCGRVGGMYEQSCPGCSTIQPGQNAVFNFNFSIPPGTACQGPFNEHFNLLVELRTWLNSAGIFWPITVGCYNGSFQSETPPSPGLVAGDLPVTNTTKIRFVNTGNVPWRNDGWTRLAYVGGGCSTFADPTWIRCDRVTGSFTNVSNSSKSWVDPGEVAEFSFVLDVPATTLPGTYSQAWQLVNEWAQWMGSSYHVSHYTVLA